MRPVFHWSELRVEAHVLICYLAFAVSRFTMERINAHFRESGSPTISYCECVRELDGMENFIMTKTDSAKLYVLPTRPKEKQQAIYASTGVDIKQKNFLL